MKRKIMLIAGMLALCICAAAQDLYYPPAREAFEQNPLLVCGNYYLVDFDVPAPTPAPKGFKPFYISTYARHGARTYNSNSAYELWDKILTLAHNDGKLTPEGERLYSEFEAILPMAWHRAGDLTPIGHKQHRRLAEKMYRSYPEIFKNHPVIDARSTTSHRVMLSMAEFCDELKTLDPTIRIDQFASEADRYILNPFSSTNPRTVPSDAGAFDGSKAIWRPEYLKLLDDHIDYKAMLGRFFTDISYAYKGAQKESMEICRWLFNIAVDVPCLTPDHDLMQFLTKDELFNFWRAENYRFYNVASRTPVFNGRNWALMECLLRNILDNAESDFESGDIQARLRFGHDFYLIGLCTLLDLDGWNIEESDPEKVDQVFRHYESPMAANIQFIFYRNKEGEILVRTELNGREVRYRIAGFSGPYYPWPAFQAFCAVRLELADRILKQTER